MTLGGGLGSAWGRGSWGVPSGLVVVSPESTDRNSSGIWRLSGADLPSGTGLVKPSGLYGASNGKTRFQSSFMLMTVHPRALASAISESLNVPNGVFAS